jgi:phage tail-like protein
VTTPDGIVPGVSIARERRFAGDRFGTRTLRVPETYAASATPSVASRRAVLRAALPAVYQDSDFTMRFVGALEQVLDPITATLDGLHYYLQPEHAPRDVLVLLCAWLGIDTDETQPTQELRALVRHGARLGRTRGTVAGMQLALQLAFPRLSLRVEDEGAVRWPGSDAGTEGRQHFVVYCDDPIPEDRQAEVARVIEREKPAHVTYKLRVRTTKKNGDPARHDTAGGA